MDTQNKVLAVVGGKAITEADVQRTLMNLGQRAQQYNNPQGKQAILEQLINKELIFMDAKKNLLEMDAEYKAELEKLKKELLSNFYVEKFLRDVKVKDEEVKKYFRNKVYTTVIPRNVRLAEAPSYGMPITEYDPTSRGAEAYTEFAEEFLDLEEE